MRLTRLTKLVIAVSMVAAAAPATAVAVPDTTPGPRPDNPALERAAEQALDAVRSAFGRADGVSSRPDSPGPRGVELTLALRELRLGFDELAPQDQRIAAAYLARPTDGNEYYGANYRKDARPTNDCKKAPTNGSEICVHWARKTSDAPPKGDKDGDGLPNQVEKTRDTMNLVWGRIVDAGGYKAPLKDDKGPNDKLDVYLVDIGGDGLYGYCGWENVGQGRAAAAYCVLDDDYAKKQYPSNTPLGNLQVTAAHEFFHAVQFAYDVREDAWMMESTATWIEDEIFDDVNDNRYYLSRSVMRSPQRPLDATGGGFLYGNWIWWRYLTERFSQENGTGLPVLVREVWERADNSTYAGTYSIEALAQELDHRGQGLANVFAEFSSQNRMPDDSSTGIYEEGHAYRKAPLSAKHRLDTKTRPGVAEKSPTLAHLSSTTVAFVPKDGYADAGWKLKVNVDLPTSSHKPFAQLTTVRTDGSVTRDFIGLTSKGAGALEVPFSSTDVRRVELTLTNGDHSYDCFEGTRWACRGVPDKKRTYSYWATTQR